MKLCHIDGFSGTYVVQSSTADTLGNGEKHLPLVGRHANSATNISDWQTAYKIPSVLKNPPNRDVAVESVHKFVDSLTFGFTAHICLKSKI